jgi:hypothetical protein
MKKRYLSNSSVGWTAMALGLATAVTPAWATATPVGAGFTLGLGAMTVIYAGWSLIARDPIRDHWSLSVVGRVLAIAPWVGGFAGDGASWVVWTTGLLLLELAGAAYLNDEAANVAETIRVKELATYQAQHPEPPPDSDISDHGQHRLIPLLSHAQLPHGIERRGSAETTAKNQPNTVSINRRRIFNHHPRQHIGLCGAGGARTREQWITKS